MGDITTADGHSTKVRIPNMFGSIMSADAEVNPHHFKVKAAADAWIAEYLKLEKYKAEKNRKSDFCFRASAMAPHVDAEALRTVVDWLNWIFYFDDAFDEGQLDHDVKAAQKEINQTLSVLTNPTEPTERDRHPFRYLFYTVWQRVKKVKATCNGDSHAQTEEDYIKMRRRTVGGYPCISLIAYAHGVNLPQVAFEHTSVQECIAVACDLDWIHNDIVSYKKVVKSGIEHNLIIVLKKNGFSTQQAMDRAGQLQDECYRRWYLALAKMPVWGEVIDREVLRYIEACHSFPLGDLLWSFQTGRDLGAKEGYRLHETRLLDLSDLE